MKEKNQRTERTCPYCGRTYTDYPAISRLDNTTEICPDCGTREALRGIGVPEDEIDHIIEAAHAYTEQKRELSEAARQARNAYYRELRRKNPERKREENRRYWERRAQRAKETGA